MDCSTTSPVVARDDGAPEVVISRSPISAIDEEEGLQKAEQYISTTIPDDVFVPRGESMVVEPVDVLSRQKKSNKALVNLPHRIASCSSALRSSQTSGSTPSATATAALPQGTSSATTPAVTSGSTGIAAYSCNDIVGSAYTSTSGTTYVEDCHTDYTAATWNASSMGSDAKVRDLDAITVYTFEACMEQCDAYNAALPKGQVPCRAVTHSANLTLDVPVHSGNCFLKDTRGADYNGDPDVAKYNLLASAYAECVVEGC